MQVTVTAKPIVSGLQTASVASECWEELKACPICGQSEYLRDIAIVEEETLATITSVCLDCEFGFFRRRPSNEWFNHFYSEAWDQAGQSKLSSGRLGIRPRPRVFEFCADYLKPASTVLDVGAGFGNVLSVFRDHGHTVSGVELSAHRASYVRDELGIPCFNVPFESVKLEDKVQLITINHVLEHVSDPHKVIAGMAATLADDGMLYVAVPEFWEEYPPQSFHFIPHLSSFSLKSLRRLLGQYGLSIVKAEVGRDIQILATKVGHVNNNVGDSDSASRAEFWEKTTQFVRRAFGERSGQHTLVWCTSGGTPYWHTCTVSGSRFNQRIIRMTAGMRPILSRIVRNYFLPERFKNRRPRMLEVDLTDNRELPVNIKHKERGTAIWVK